MRARALLVSVVVLASLSAPALADPTGAEQALAEQLFREGQQLLVDGKVDIACPKLAESQRIAPKLGTLLNLATCHEKEGKTATAWGEFNEALALARAAKRADRVQFAQEHADALEKVLARVEIVGAQPGVQVTLDERPFATAAMGSKVPVDPGEHVIEASAPGKRAWSKHVTAIASSTQQIVIPVLEAPNPLVDPPAPPPYAPPQPAIAPMPTSMPSDDGGSQRTVGLIVGGVGAAGLAVGGVFGAMTLSSESRANKVCPQTVCPTQEGYDLHQTARRDALISTLAIIGGAAALATGAVVFFTAKSATKPAASLHVGPASATLLGTF
jgi:hypothetical protein